MLVNGNIQTYVGVSSKHIHSSSLMNYKQGTDSVLMPLTAEVYILLPTVCLYLLKLDRGNLP